MPKWCHGGYAIIVTCAVGTAHPEHLKPPGNAKFVNLWERKKCRVSNTLEERRGLSYAHWFYSSGCSWELTREQELHSAQDKIWAVNLKLDVEKETESQVMLGGWVQNRNLCFFCIIEKKILQFLLVAQIFCLLPHIFWLDIRFFPRLTSTNWFRITKVMYLIFDSFFSLVSLSFSKNVEAFCC